jgi:hypothetical protein
MGWQPIETVPLNTPVLIRHLETDADGLKLGVWPAVVT